MENSINNQVEKKNNYNIIAIVLVVIGLILIGVAVFKIFTDKPKTETPNNNQENNGNNNTASDGNVYKTKDGKYTLKLLENDKVLINDKEVVMDTKEEDNRYIEIQGDFYPSPNYISGLGFVLDKNTHLIVESPQYKEGNIDTDCGYESYGEYARFCTRCYGFNVLNINNWNFFEIFNEVGANTIYTTNWKELGYIDSDNVRFDNNGIYVCNSHFDSTCESGETKYDVDGNVVNS